MAKLALTENRSIYSNLDSFEAAQRMAKALSSSDFVPTGFKGNISNTLIAIEVANRYGSLHNPPSVLAVMQNMYVVHGKPGFESKFIIGLVNTCGRFGPMRWEFVGKSGTPNWGAAAIVKDLTSGEVLKGTTVTMEMADKEGWLGKSGSKWQTMPEQMLKYRSAAFWIRTFAPELLMGMYIKDELEDTEELVSAEIVDDTPKDELEQLADRLTQ